jgi:hypothetical protein
MGDFNLSQASLTWLWPEALATLHCLPTENPMLYAALNQTSSNGDANPMAEEDLFAIPTSMMTAMFLLMS